MNVSHPSRHLIFSGRYALILAALALLTGCNNSPYSVSQQNKKVLYLTLAQDVNTLDPSIAYDVDSESLTELIYSSYFRYDHLKQNPFQLDLSLGAQMPVVKPVTYLSTQPNGTKKEVNGQLWTFRVRPGLHFQNDPCFPGGRGREILGSDFLFTFRRMADPAIPCPIVSYFDQKIEGMAAYEAYNRKRIAHHQKTDYSYPIAGLQLVPGHPHMFRILLNQPYPQLRYLMAMTLTAPLPSEAIQKYGAKIATHPVGCGQFILKTYVPRGRYVLVKNPNRPYLTYPSTGMPGDRKAGLLQDAGRQLPLVDEVQFNIIPEGTTVWNEFLQGYLDITGVSQNNFQQAMPRPDVISPDLKARGVKLRKVVSLDINYYIFNMDDPVVGGYSQRARLLRQAVSMAVNSKEEIDLETLGLGMQAQWLTPPGIFGFNPNYVNPYRQFNLQKAKALLAEAGYPKGIDPSTGKPLVIYYDNSAVNAQGRQALAITQREIDSLGINLVSRSWRNAEFQDRINGGRFQFTSWGWVADYPDSENFAFLLYSRNKRPGPNVSNYSNPLYDAVFRKMRSLNDTPQRAALIQQLTDISAPDCPLIYTSHSEAYGLVQPWLLNYKPNPIALDGPDYLNINMQMRTHLRKSWNQPQIWPIVLIFGGIFLSALPAIGVVRKRSRRHLRRDHTGAAQ